MFVTLSLLLALQPRITPSDPPAEIDEVEVIHSTDSIHVLAYDPDGEVAAEIVVWSDGDGRTRLDTNFADGEYLRVVADGDELVEHEASAAAELRIAALVEVMQLEEGEIECLHAVTEMVGGWVAVHWFCPALMLYAACNCDPDFAEEHSICG